MSTGSYKASARRVARTRVAFGDSPLLTVALPAWRSKLTMAVLFVAFSVLVGRALMLQGGVKTDFLQRQGAARYARTLEMPATRGKVTDRHGAVLAASVPARAIWAIPEDVKATGADLERLAQALNMPIADLKRKLAQDRSFVYLRRQVDLDVAKRIAAMKLAGIHESREYKRHYPEGGSTAHVVGFTNVEDQGQEGIERVYDTHLSGRVGSRRVIKDRLGRVVEDVWLRAPVDGQDLALSIDSRIQHIAVSALKEAVDTHHAISGSAVVLDARTGEILALVNAPSFDPNRRARLIGGTIRNRVLTDSFEPGSTLKPFSIAAALELGYVRPNTVIQTAGGRLRIGNRTINDTHVHDTLTVEQVLAKSSNVGTAKIALDLPARALWGLYTEVGFGRVPEQAPRDFSGQSHASGFIGAVAGSLRPYKTWRPIEQATISYGYGVSVSLLQLAQAYLVFARDGDMVPLSLLRLDARSDDSNARAVLNPNTARAIRGMLERAASDEGTAPAARTYGYRVAGKTGTARKIKEGRYVNAYVASFAGFAPVSDPRLIVAVMIDEPDHKRKGGRYYGGDVAAPVFSKIVGQSLNLLQVVPDATAPTLRDPAAVQLVQSTVH